MKRQNRALLASTLADGRSITRNAFLQFFTRFDSHLREPIYVDVIALPQAPDVAPHRRQSPVRAATLIRYRPDHSRGNAARIHPAKTSPGNLDRHELRIFPDRSSAHNRQSPARAS